MKDRGDDVIIIFGTFVKQFNDFVSFTEKIDETYRINIGWYIMMLVSIIMNSLYSTILFAKCYSIRFQVLGLIIDSMSLLLLLLITLSVYSMLRNMLTKGLKINWSYENFFVLHQQICLCIWLYGVFLTKLGFCCGFMTTVK